MVAFRAVARAAQAAVSRHIQPLPPAWESEVSCPSAPQNPQRSLLIIFSLSSGTPGTVLRHRAQSQESRAGKGVAGRLHSGQRVMSVGFFDAAEQPLGYGWDDGVSESFKSVQPMGYP